MFSLFFDNNEKQGKRPDFLDEAWTYYKKRIAKPEPANIDFDLLLVDNETGKKVGAEIKERDDLYGSLPPRGVFYAMFHASRPFLPLFVP